MKKSIKWIDLQYLMYPKLEYATPWDPLDNFHMRERVIQMHLQKGSSFVLFNKKKENPKLIQIQKIQADTDGKFFKVFTKAHSYIILQSQFHSRTYVFD